MADEEENKVVLIGESGVGKTCIINQFINNEYNDDTKPTMTYQFCQKTFEFPGNKKITLDIWDTAGQERYRSLNTIFYKNVRVAILVYDITNKISFEEAKNFWYEQVKQNCDNKKLILAVAANKCDLYEERQVKDEEGEKYAKSIGAFYASTSAKNDSGINDLFEKIANKLLNPNSDLNANGQEAEEKDENGNDTKEEVTENNIDNSRKSVKLDKNNNAPKKDKKKCC